MSGFAVGKPTRFTLRESVADRLRTAISEGNISPGTHLAEVELSESLEVSRATLREALRQLQQEGLLTQDSRGRVSVRRVLPSEVHDIFEARLGLESIAVRRLCSLPANEREEAVEKLRVKLERLKYRMSIREDLDSDLDFHEGICSLAGNPVLHRAWLSISGVIRVTMVAAGEDPARANAAYERHAPIVDFIASGDIGGARGFLEKHMETAADLLIERMGAESVGG